MSLRISFIPVGAPGHETWTLRVPAGPERAHLPGLSDAGEVVDLARPDLDELDRRMLQQRSGYSRRLLATGAIEISVSGERAKTVVREWLLTAVLRKS